MTPSFQGGFAISCPSGEYNHARGFTACAGTDEANNLPFAASKGMAIAGWTILTDEIIARKVWEDFNSDGALDEQETL